MGTQTPTVDARGHTIVPGFIDAHAHLHELGRGLRQVDLRGVRSPEGVVDSLNAVVAQRSRSSNKWLRGHGWEEAEGSPPPYAP